MEFYARALALASCAKVQLVLNENRGGTHVFSATVLSSKTTLGDKGDDNSYPNLWVTGNLLNVNGVTSDPLDEKYNGLASAEFSITGELTTPYIAVYLANSEYASGSNSSPRLRFV